MARERYELTAEVQQAIVAYVRAGGYPHVAAEAAGVPGRVFERWLRRAAEGDERFRALAEAVRQARAQAGWGRRWRRATSGRWTGCAAARASRRRSRPDGRARCGRRGRGGGLVLLEPEAQALFRAMLAGLGAFPEARVALARVAIPIIGRTPIRIKMSAERARSLVRVMLPAALAGELLRRAARHDLDEQRLLRAVLAQQASQPLDVLAHRSRARQHDADVGGRHVHALVEDSAGDDDGILAGLEAVEDVPPLTRLRLVGDGGHEVAAAIS